jgi:membrane-bound serine protease (ClpP class)
MSHHSPSSRSIRWPVHLARMAMLVLLSLLCAGLLLLTASVKPAPARADGAHVDIVKFNRDVDPASTNFLTGAIDTAQQDGASALVLVLDTPGGDLDSMRTDIEKELVSSTPIIAFVGPQGAHAASAGTFLALAAPVVAMAPNTRIGAASPVTGTGDNLPSTLDTKVKQDLTAIIRRLQTTYHRKTAPAEATVNDAASYNDTEALANGLVDLQASSLDDLLAQVDGRVVTLATGAQVTLRTAGASQTQLEPTLANEVQAFLADPTVLFLLFILAAACLYIELSHPGAIVPGVIGALALILFLFSAGSIQPNWAGLALMLLAIVLLAIDVRAPTHGFLTIGALVSLVIGALIFFDTGTNHTGPGLNPLALVGAVAALGAISLAILSFAIRAQRRPVTTGVEGLVGQTATVIVALTPSGRVRLRGENWAARLASGDGMARVGDLVRVTAIDHITLIVEPASPALTTPREVDTWT